jgi:MFS transporter, FHS family, L-fucose permease
MNIQKGGATAPRNTLAFVLIVSLFFAWGIANSLNDILIPQFKKAFILTDLQTGLVQSAFYAGYFLLAIPASLFSRRFGYKAAVICGLVIFGLGAFLFLPAAKMHAYPFFLGALWVIASGLAFLETSANPLVTVLGAPETSGRRLNFAQAFNPLGSLTGVFVGRWFILSDHKLSSEQLSFAVVGPYMTISVCILIAALIFCLVKFPPVATQRTREADPAGGFLPLFHHPRFLFGVMAQFFYICAQVGVWSFTIRYAQHAVPNIPVTRAADILFWSLFAFMVGRFVGTALMGRIRPEKLMAIYAGTAAVLTLIATVVGGWTGVYALAATSFFMSIMFPTIFAGAIRDLGSLTKSGSSFLVMAIVGGAVAPPIMGLISGMSSMQYAMAIPCFSFIVVMAFAVVSSRAGKTG